MSSLDRTPGLATSEPLKQRLGLPSELETNARLAFTTEARSWIGTSYVLGARIKGGGADCASFIAECLVACGLSDREDLGVYSHDWFCHTEENRYMFRLLRHAQKTLETIGNRSLDLLPGCIVLTKAANSRIWNHGAIIIDYPMAVHAVYPKVAEFNIMRHMMWAFQPQLVVDPIRVR